MEKTYVNLKSLKVKIYKKDQLVTLTQEFEINTAKLLKIWIPLGNQPASCHDKSKIKIFFIKL